MKFPCPNGAGTSGNPVRRTDRRHAWLVLLLTVLLTLPGGLIESHALEEDRRLSSTGLSSTERRAVNVEAPLNSDLASPSCVAGIGDILRFTGRVVSAPSHSILGTWQIQISPDRTCKVLV